MRSLRIVILVLATGLVAGNARGQFGLYGAPEMLPMPRTGAWVYLPAAAAQGAPVHTGYGRPVGIPPGRLFPVGAFPAQPAPPRPPLPLNGPIPSNPVSPSGTNPIAHPSVTPQPDVAYGGQYWVGCDQYRGASCQSSGGFAAYRWSPWYGSVSELVMTRNKANTLWLSYQTDVESNQLGGHSWDWAWGGEIRIGRRFSSCCTTGCGECEEYCDPGVGGVGVGGVGDGMVVPNGWALETVYSILTPLNAYTSTTSVPSVSTPLDFEQGPVRFNGFLATDWFDRADEHRVWRESNVQSLELNLVRSQLYLPTGLPWTVDWSFGVRYFRFDDRLTFGSLRGGGAWAVAGDAAYLEDRVVNNLIGLQFGFDAKYRVTPSLRTFVTPKFGIYGNHMNNRFRLNLGDGSVATQPTFPATYPVNSSENGVSFLTQIDLGVLWDFSRHWSAHIGYRVVVVTAVALADDQIPPYIVDVPEIADIDNNAELILHGGFFGLTYNF